jgi:hypothetical protein
VCLQERVSLYVYMSMRADTSYVTQPKIEIPHIIELMVVIFEIYYVVHIPVIIKIHDTLQISKRVIEKHRLPNWKRYVLCKQRI